MIDGVTAGATGAIAGAVFVLGRRALTDVATWMLFVVSLALVLWVKKLPEPALILGAGVVGILLHGVAA
jgi:chromate transporter